MKTKTTHKKTKSPKGSVVGKRHSTGKLLAKQRKIRNKRLAIFAAAAFAFCSILGVIGVLAAPTPVYKFVSGVGNEKCLDNAGQKLELNNTIMLYACNNTPAQRWVRSGNTIQIAGSAYCLDKTTKTVNGLQRQYAVLNRCNRSSSQQWKVDTKANTIVSMQNNMCLDVQGGKATDRAPIILWQCAKGAKNQIWYMRATTNTTPIPDLSETASVKVEGATTKVNFEVGFDYTQNSRLFGGGNKAAVDSAKGLAKSLNAPQSTHILGFGLGTPSPSKGKYTWGDLDARVNMMKSTTSADKRTIILCCAPKWMKNTRTDADNNADLEKAPTKANYDNFATLSAEIVKRYGNDVKNYVVWNELKGFGSAPNYDAKSYTELYNKVYDAIKRVRTDVKVGGPYMGMHTDAPTGTETYGHLAAHSKNVMTYWLQNKRGADFMAVDSGPQLKDGTLATNGYTAGLKFADDARYLRSLPGAGGMQIWWMEFYPATERDNTYVDPTGNHAVSITMSNIITAGQGGINKMLVWEPEGMTNGAHPYTGYGLWTSTGAAGGGKATSFYNALKTMKDNFPTGTQLHKVTTTGKVSAMASGSKVLLISRSANNLTVDVAGKKTPLKPYEVKVVAR